MREIKFRAWHLPTKKIFEVYSLCEEAVFENSMDGVHTSPTLPAERKDCILMQFTGLKDKKGVDIYEGDILSLKKEASLYKCPITIVGFVEYIAGKYEVNTVKCININVNNCTSVYFGMKVMDWIHLTEFYKSEIIGNIYENPELL